MRAVVLGGGYAGVVATSRLEESPAVDDVVLIDDTGTHLIRHELHRVIRRPDLADRIEIPLERVVFDATVLERTVESIDTEENLVDFAGDDSLPFDVAIVCLGSRPSYDGLPGVEHHSIPITSPERSSEINRRVESLIENGGGDIAIGGGGLTGIQVAGEVAEMIGEGTSDVTISLLEQAETVAPGFDSEFREAIHSTLREKGVHVRVGTTIERATDERVRTEDGESLPADVLVWAGGIRGVEPFDWTRPRVRADVRLDDRVFVAGDVARVVDVNGTEATPSAQSSIRQAKVAVENARKVLSTARDSTAFRPTYARYRFAPFAWVVSVGDAAVAQVGPQVLTGRAAKAIKSTVGVGYLSSAGAIDEAVDVIRMEFGFSSSSGP